MILQIASDLHLEHAPLSALPVIGDVLVLAGDISTSAGELRELLESLPPDKPIILTLGNHEFDNRSFSDVLPLYRKAVEGLANVHLLERESIEINGVTFLGAILWSDMRGGQEAEDIALLLDAFGMREGYQPLSATRLLREHRRTLTWLGRDCPRSGRTVVVTHFAPSFRSQHPRFRGAPLGGFFCSDLDWFVESLHPSVWVHGHVHDPFDYHIGRTRIVCNPRGYPNEHADAQGRKTWDPAGVLVEI